MAFTYDLDTAVGKVRALIRDTVQASAIFTDEELTAFLTLENQCERSAAALALETIAGQQSYVVKVIQILDLKMDGTAVAKSLLAVAERLRKSAEDDWCGFEIAEVVDNSQFAYWEKQWKLLVAQEV